MRIKLYGFGCSYWTSDKELGVDNYILLTRSFEEAREYYDNLYGKGNYTLWEHRLTQDELWREFDRQRAGGFLYEV